MSGDPCRPQAQGHRCDRRFVRPVHPAGHSRSHPVRQRTRVRRQGGTELDRGCRCQDRLHRARQPLRERLHRGFNREDHVMPNRREVLRAGAALPAALAAATLIPEALRAQTFPARTITIVAPFPPGGVADYAARPLAAFLGTKFGKNVVVENRPGAGGGVGHAYVARAEPDGHTIMCSLPSLAVIPEANRLQGRPVNYEMTDFVPLARLFADPVLLVVKKEAKWRNIQELVEDIKSNPGKIPYGSSGVFGTVHLAQEMFLNAAGLQMMHVPYQGGGPAVNAILSDQVPVLPTV